MIRRLPWCEGCQQYGCKGTVFEIGQPHHFSWKENKPMSLAAFCRFCKTIKQSDYNTATEKYHCLSCGGPLLGEDGFVQTELMPVEDPDRQYAPERASLERIANTLEEILKELQFSRAQRA